MSRNNFPVTLVDENGKRIGKPFRIVVKQPALTLRRMESPYSLPSPLFNDFMDKKNEQLRNRLVDLMRSGYSAVEALEVVQREIQEQLK